MSTIPKGEMPSINPIEDQRKQALAHYEEASSAIHHWSGFVENAIKAFKSPCALCEGKEKEIAELKNQLEQKDEYYLTLIKTLKITHGLI